MESMKFFALLLATTGLFIGFAAGRWSRSGEVHVLEQRSSALLALNRIGPETRLCDVNRAFVEAGFLAARGDDAAGQWMAAICGAVTSDPTEYDWAVGLLERRGREGKVRDENVYQNWRQMVESARSFGETGGPPQAEGSP
ncbi:MAG: hypothetical protein SNJ74_11480 [Fimbriimonadaceae bacterium]